MKKILFTLFFLTFPTQVLAHHRLPIQVKTMDEQVDFELPLENEAGGASLDVADLGNDGTQELLIGNGLGNEPRVRVVRKDGSEIGSFLAYAPNMGAGINVIACDLTGDGFHEIVVAPQRGGGPHVRVFDRFGHPLDHGGFFAYNAAFRGGVNLACGDLDDVRGAELVTLPGPGGGSHVRIWKFDVDDMSLHTEFFAFDAQDTSGLIGTVHDHHLLLSQQHATQPIMKLFDDSLQLIEQKKIDTRFPLSVFIANEKRYITTQAGDIFSVDETTTEHVSEEPIVADAITNDADTETIVYLSSKQFFNNDHETRILVDISEQRLYAYRDGVLDHTFLVSTGLGDLTPLGIHQILAKIYEVDYQWVYGPNDPRNYDLGLVPYNLRFYPHIYLHYAYWHNNFGHKMSHGCVNVSLSHMQWLYAWAEEGMEVEVRE